jgi:type VI secretion system protein ImpK
MVLGAFCALVSLHVWLDQHLRQQARLVALAREAVRVVEPMESIEPIERASASVALAQAMPNLSEQFLFASKLAEALAPDVAAQRVHMDQHADRITLTLHTDGMFASGSDRVATVYLPLIRRIGDVLRDVSGQVVVVGHTDAQRPAPGMPSNWALSLSRATRVVDLLRQQAGQPERFFVQGKGDTDPIASNDITAGQARNRRVVITILAPGASV